MTFWTRAAWVLCAVSAAFLSSGHPTLFGQTEAESLKALRQRLVEMEQAQLDLRTRLLVLEDRLNALLGEDRESAVYRIPLRKSPVRGDLEAPLTLIVFGDYQSDHSSRAQFAISRLLEAYPTELRVVHKHYPLRTLHPYAHDAALAAIAAGRQGRFWEMHELLYRNSRTLEPSLYPLLANQIGLDLIAFQRDRTSLWALELLTEDEKQAVEASVDSVPALFLNGRRMRTWRYDYVKGEIERLLEP